jgi:hypothetical protein
MPEPTPPPSLEEGATKVCRKCTEVKPIEGYAKCASAGDGRQRWCRACSNAYQSARQKSYPEAYAARSRAHRISQPVLVMLARARFRAKAAGAPFDLTPTDVEIPERCPILCIELSRGDGRPSDNSPSLDRLVPHLGYVKDNVVVISHRANRLKNDASLEELEALTAWLARHVAPSPRKRRNPA